MKLGAHFSISGKISNALIEAGKIRANVVQIFSSSPRGWQGPEIKKDSVDEFKKLARKYEIKDIFIHGKYLINLASDNKETVEKSIESLVNDMRLADKIGAVGVIFYPHIKNEKKLIENIREVLRKTPEGVFLILEVAANTKIEDIGGVIKKIGDKRLKFCLDTAHIYEAGYDIKTEEGFRRVLRIIQDRVGFERWVVIHANDSITRLGSHHDIHANIGEGEIGDKGFEMFLKNKITRELPYILETPVGKRGSFKSDLDKLKMLSFS